MTSGNGVYSVSRIWLDEKDVLILDISARMANLKKYKPHEDVDG